MASEIRCKDSAGNGCGKLLGKVESPVLTIICPRCGKPHEVPIVALVQELVSYLEQIEARAGQAAGGKGFLL